MTRFQQLKKCNNKDEVITWLMDYSEDMFGAMISDVAVDEYLDEDADEDYT